MEQRRLKFQNHSAEQKIFFQTLTKRVNAYFEQKSVGTKANLWMLVKIVFCLSLFVTLYLCIILGNFSLPFTFFLVMLFGLSNTFIGFNIAHDAIHNALFASSKLNRLFGYAFELIGMSSYAWYLKHNIVHHNNPNVRNADFDIEAGPIMRLSPSDKLLPHHRYQHIFAPFAYMLFSLSLIFYDDLVVIFQTRRECIDSKPHPQKEKIIAIVAKCLYIFFMLILPMIVMDFSNWQILFGFFLMHCLNSIILAMVLIPAHLFENTLYPSRNEQGKIDSHWAVHQMQTTIDYSRESRICNLLFGGLNLNVVHHLFPNICHIHLIPLSGIVKHTAKEFGIVYHETSIWGAMISHFKTLKMLGKFQNFPLEPE